MNPYMMNGFGNMAMRGSPGRPDETDMKPKPQLLNPPTVLPAFMPGQQGLLASQLNQGFGGGMDKWSGLLGKVYSPMTVPQQFSDKFGVPKFEDFKSDNPTSPDDPRKPKKPKVNTDLVYYHGGDH